MYNHGNKYVDIKLLDASCSFLFFISMLAAVMLTLLNVSHFDYWSYS